MPPREAPNILSISCVAALRDIRGLLDCPSFHKDGILLLCQ
jgi:hypothetical protein